MDEMGKGKRSVCPDKVGSREKKKEKKKQKKEGYCSYFMSTRRSCFAKWFMKTDSISLVNAFQPKANKS
jgi:hypothetical protein